jgi:hypothetical protein
MQSEAAIVPASSVTEAATNGIRYWEPRRLIYNAVLSAVVVIYFFAGWPVSREALSVNVMLNLFQLAVIANVLYSSAYVPDVFVQLSSLRPAWLRSRWLLFLVGTTFAATFARFISIALFTPRGLR